MNRSIVLRKLRTELQLTTAVDRVTVPLCKYNIQADNVVENDF